MRAYIWREGQSGFAVWLHSEHTNSRVECIGHFNNKRAAMKAARTHNKRVG